MRITRIGLTDFKSHEALEIEPAAGLTIIRGPNEAGKSSIQQAIELVLYRKADANREDIRQARAWGSSRPPQVSLDFEIDGEPGTLTKRFDGSHSHGELNLEGRTITDYALIGDRLADATGIPTESFFRATASVSHRELEAVGGDEPLIGDRLQKAISGADHGTAKAKKKLEAAIHRYRTQGQKNPGLLKVVREEMAMLEGELANGEAALARLEADRAQWVEAHERREKLDLMLTRSQADLDEAQRASNLLEQRDQARDRYDRLKRAAELIEQADTLQRGLPSKMPLPQLRSDVKRMSGLAFELSELEADIATATEAGPGDVGVAPPRPLRWLAVAGVLVALGVVFTLAFDGAGVVGAFVVAAFMAGVLVALTQAARMALRRRQHGLAVQLAERAAAQRAESDRQRVELFRRERHEFESISASLGVADIEAAEQLLRSAEEHAESLAQIDGELRGLGVESRDLRRFEEARDEAADETQRATHALAAIGSLGRDPEAALEKARREVAEATPARDQARSEEDQAQGRVDANQVDAELVAGLAERLAAARERQTELERRMLLYQGTLSAIEAAEQATLKTAARYLEERMGPTISAITDGRYDDIEVDEQSLAFKVRAPETGAYVEVERLSQGTADQLFLAARLGLVRLVTMDRRPPLILDDPFVTFDWARGERALRLIKRFASEEGFQVLYLTCSDRFDQLADELVVLPGPSNERVAATPAPGVAAAPGVAVAPGQADQPSLGLDAESEATD